MPLGILSKASKDLRVRWEAEVEKLRVLHPSLKVETLRTLAAHRIFGICDRLRRARHQRVTKGRLLELRRREALRKMCDHAWERVAAYTVPDPVVRKMLEDIARMYEAECARWGVPPDNRLESHSDAKNAILEHDAGDSTRSGTGSDGHLSRNPLHGPGGEDTPRAT